MRHYNFNESLNWQQFQRLACEVVGCRENFVFQTFKDGRDSGIDGLWWNSNHTIVLQAKRYKSFNNLYKQLKIEIEKVRKINPIRYILVISLPLTQDQAEKIYKLFSDFIISSDDLIDANKLNAFLSMPYYREIEKQFVELRVRDISILNEYLNSKIPNLLKTRNIREWKKIEETSKYFVQTAIYEKARKQLEENHAIIISGQPGMGKTTIARMLAREVLNEYREGLYWLNNVDEIDSYWKHDNSYQIFVLDDYWGAAFYRKRNRSEAQKFEDIIVTMREEKNKWLIITSREYIVQDFIKENPEIGKIINDFKLECVLKEYNKAEKAQILFSHLKNADLDWNIVEHIFHKSEWIINNQNYNPRVIEQFFKNNAVSNMSEEDYFEKLEEWLKHPDEMWEGVFKELSEESKMLSFILAISYTPIAVDDIYNTYIKFMQLFSSDKPLQTFDKCITELEKTVLFTYMNNENDLVCVEFENPSILDFILKYISANREFYIPKLIKSSVFYNQLLMLLEFFYADNKEINKMIEKECVDKFYSLPMKLSDYGERDMDWEKREAGSDWSGRAFHLMRISAGRENGYVWKFIEKFVKEFFINIENNKLFNGPHEICDFTGLLKVCEKYGMHFEPETIIQNYLKYSCYYWDYVGLKNLKEIYPKEFEKIDLKLKNFLKNNIKEILLNSLEAYEWKDYNETFDLLVDAIPEILKEHGVRYTKAFKREIYEIAGRYYEPQDVNTVNCEIKEKLRKYENYEKIIEREEKEYKKVKDEFFEYLYGINQYIEDKELKNLVKLEKFTKIHEKFLLKAIDCDGEWYINEFLYDENSIKILKIMETNGCFDKSIENFVDFANNISFIILENFGDYKNEVVELCIEFVEQFIKNRNTLVLIKNFEKLPSYNLLISKDVLIKEKLFEYLFDIREKWLSIKYDVIVLYWYCIVKNNSNFTLTNDTVSDLKNFLLKQADKKYFKNLEIHKFEEQRLLHKIMDSIYRGNFRKYYVIPELKSFLKKYEDNEKGIYKFLKHLELELKIDRDKEIYIGSHICDDAMILAENLDIAYLWDIDSEFSSQVADEILLRKNICVSDVKDTTVYIFKEKDFEFLASVGLIKGLRDYLNKIREFVQINEIINGSI